MVKKLCVISAYYPSKDDPHYAFVGTLISAVADMGIECYVITPVSRIEKKHKAESRTELSASGKKIHVYCPHYNEFPSRKIFGYETYRLTVFSKQKAIRRAFERHVKDCDAIYSHFIDSGVQAALLSDKTDIPAFVAVGESRITNKKLDYTIFKDVLHQHINGVISVSSELKKDMTRYDVFSPETPVAVFPNSIDTELFKPHDKERCRARLGIAEDDFVISFVGGFIKRKGFDKLQDAIARHPDWKCILIGTGELAVTLPASQVIFSGRIPHDQIPGYLCASDVFALPTQAEGCCNAIVEAMGCGLPIVSSDRGFNYDILTRDYATLINPENVDEIDYALTKLSVDAEMRKVFAERSLHAGKALSIENRASHIVEFMGENL